MSNHNKDAIVALESIKQLLQLLTNDPVISLNEIDKFHLRVFLITKKIRDYLAIQSKNSDKDLSMRNYSRVLARLYKSFGIEYDWNAIKDLHCDQSDNRDIEDLESKVINHISNL